MHTFNQASSLFLWSGATYWKTIMRAGACLSRKAVSHWRDSLTRLTFDFSKSLEIRWRGHHWASLVMGEGPVNEWTPLSVCMCASNRGQWQVNPHPLLLFIQRRLVTGTPALWGKCVCVCTCKSGNEIGWEWWQTGMSSTLLSLTCLTFIQPDTHSHKHAQRAINTQSHTRTFAYSHKVK